MTARRKVVTSQLREGRGGLLGPDTARRIRWWDLTLECGHIAERFARYSGPSMRRYGGHRSHPIEAVLPAPQSVNCDSCARGLATKEPIR